MSVGRLTSTRRDVLRILGSLGCTAFAGCLEPPQLPQTEQEPVDWPEVPWDDTDFDPDMDPDERAEANVKALMNVLIPAERDDAGEVVSAGALEVGAYELLSLSTFIPAGRSLGLLPELPQPLEQGVTGFDAVLRGIVSTDLDALAFEISPWSPFSSLVPAQQREVVAKGFDDPLVAPMLHFVRAACFIAFLGAVHSDAGLQALGFPPFEDFEDRVAVSGYPRTTDGRLVDAQTEDLVALQEQGVLDDYTYNQEPQPTPGDDLSGLLDERGDFV